MLVFFLFPNQCDFDLSLECHFHPPKLKVPISWMKQRVFAWTVMVKLIDIGTPFNQY